MDRAVEVLWTESGSRHSMINVAAFPTVNTALSQTGSETHNLRKASQGGGNLWLDPAWSLQIGFLCLSRLCVILLLIRAFSVQYIFCVFLLFKFLGG